MPPASISARIVSRFPALNRSTFAWALYDWANSAFALSVLAVLFPLFLGVYWSADAPDAVVTSRLSFTNAIASLVVVLIAPILGTIADAGGLRKRFLLVFGLLGAASTASLAFVGESDWFIACTAFLLASVGYYGSMTFYDSLLIDVTRPNFYAFVSNLGFSLGYLGGAVLLAIHVVLLRDPAAWGLADTDAAFRLAFFSVGAWWALFMLPILALVKEQAEPGVIHSGFVAAAYRELRQTLGRIGQYRNVVTFLVAYWLYIGGVFTVISMAVDYGRRLGFDQTDLVTALLITNLAGFPATLAYGLLGHRYGPRFGIYLAIVVYIVMASWAAFMTDVWQFYVMAVVIGCVQGGIQGLSRSLYAALIPAPQRGEFFGFYNMLTKFAHVVGLTLVGIAATLSDNPKWVLFVLLPLFVSGGLLLRVVRSPDAAAAT